VGGIAWVLLNGKARWFGGGSSSTAAADDGKERAVAVAYVDVEAGVTPLYPVRAGRVVEVFVKEGDDVEKDQALVKVDDSLAQEQLAEAEIALKGAKVAKEHAETLAAQQKDAVHAQEKKVAIRRAEVSEADAYLAKAKRYYQERLGGSVEDVRIAEQTVKKAHAAVDAELAELARIKNLGAGAEVAVKATDVQIEAKQRQIDKAKLDLKNYVLRSPAKGKILRSFVNVGEALGSNPQRPAMEFAPVGSLIVRAEIEQEFVGHVKKGMKARVYDYDASNDHVWRGEVERVSDWISKRRSQVYEPMQFNDVRTLEAIIKLKDEPQYPLRIGQRVRVVLEW
jgi:multidrug resistance efflux pump